MEESKEARRARIREHMVTPIDDVVAEKRLIAVLGSERREILLQIGRPYRVDDEEYRCPVAAWGVDNRYPDMAGGGSLQALFLATRLLKSAVSHWASLRSAKFLYPGYEDEQEAGIELLDAIFGATKKMQGDSK